MACTGTDPWVSFVVPSYNRAEVLCEVLSQLRPEKLPFACETLVVDNASSDDSVARVRRHFPEVSVHALSENLGTASRNVGLAEARGQYVMMLDDDSYPLGDSLERGVERLQEDKARRLGAIAYRVRLRDGSYEAAGISSSFVGCGALFRTADLKQAGGYPAGYLFYAEEYDVAFELLRRGQRVANPQETEVLHLKSNLNRDTGRILRQLVRNNLLLWSKFLPPTLAQRQISTEIWRYRHIARKEHVEENFEQGLEQGLALVDGFRTDRSRQLSQEHAAQALGLPGVHAAVSKLRESHPQGRVLLWSMSKQVHWIVEALRGAGLQAIGIVEDNPSMQGHSFEGVPIVPSHRLGHDDYDCVQIASSSLAVGDRLCAAAERMGIGHRVRRLSDYDA